MSAIPEKCQRCGQRVPFITLSGNILLGAVKSVAGILGGSVGLTVDGFHSLSDGIGTTFVLCSLRVANKPRDASHPYGYGKAEFLASLVVFMVLIGVGVVFLVNSVGALLEGRKEPPHLLGLLAALVSVLANYIMYNFNLCAGRRLNSPALVANGYENLTDLFSSIPVAAGIVGAQFGYTFCDPLAGALVSVFIIFNATRESWRSVGNLVDRAAPPATRRRIHRLATSVDGVLGTEEIRTRLVGKRLWVDLGVKVAPERETSEASRIAATVRERLLHKGKYVEDVVVYFFSEQPVEETG